MIIRCFVFIFLTFLVNKQGFVLQGGVNAGVDDSTSVHIQQGKKTLARELKHIIDTHLKVSIKPEKANNKVSIKALEKFNDLLNEENYH